MPRVIRDDGARLEYEVRPAAGPKRRGAFIFQHGMGGQRQQPLGYVGAFSGFDLICMDARGHGNSSDVVDPTSCTFDGFADDVVALADHLGLEKFVTGGISLGAAVALNLAIRYPQRPSALILCRPAWLEAPQADANREAYAHIADLLDTHEVDDALDVFVSSDAFRSVESESGSAASSLRHQITRPRAAINAEILRRFPGSSPAPQLESWQSVAVPTLVIGHGDDPFHPWDIAKTMAGRLPNARVVEVTSKDADANLFATEINDAITGFVESVPVG